MTKKIQKIEKRQKDKHRKITTSGHFSTPAKFCFQGKDKTRKRQNDIFRTFMKPCGISPMWLAN